MQPEVKQKAKGPKLAFMFPNNISIRCDDYNKAKMLLTNFYPLK